MNRSLALLLVISMLIACKSKQKDTGNADRPLTFEDFQGMFAQTEAPYRLPADSLLNPSPDSPVLKRAVVKQFLTDTLAGDDFPKASPPRFYPLAHFQHADMHYFVVKAAGKTATAAYLCFTDQSGKYLSSVRVAKVNPGGKTRVGFSLDSKFLIKISTELQVSPRHKALKEDFYTANPDGSLTLIMTNSNEPTTPGQIFNPIDTLPRKHKYSADYASGDMNIESISDGADTKSYLFFISFSKTNGNCRGELSGTGQFTGPGRGEYKDNESSCGIAFQFSSSRVSIREIGGCGAYRGVTCFFEGAFAKKKVKKQADAKR